MTVSARVVSFIMLVGVVLAQVSVVQRFEIGDASPDIVILVVVSLALLSSSVEGAAFGFAAGVLVALFAAVPLGPHAMVGTVVGYLAGRWGEQLVTDEHPVPPLVAGVVGTVMMVFGRPMVEFLVRPGSAAIGGTLSNSAVAIVLGAALSIPVYVMVRRLVMLVTAPSGAAPAASRSGGEA